MISKCPGTEHEVLAMSGAYNMYCWVPQKYAMDRIAVKSAEGCYFTDYNGNRYLDASSQLMNVNIGLQNKKVRDAIKEQVDELCYINTEYATSIRARLGRKIIEDIVPGMGKVLFTQGGADANEYAIRTAHFYTGKYKFLTQYMGIHGFTYGAANLNGQHMRGTIEPGIAGFVHFMGPWWREHGLKFDTEEEYTAFLLRLLEKTIIQENPNKIAAIVTETMLGAGGAIQMPKGYLQGMRELCDKYGILLICDEVMVGFGRTGKWFTFMHYGVMPDIITFSKGVTSGYIPLGGMIISKKMAEFFEEAPLPIDFTYNAHPVGCAAALATIEVYEEENLFENAEKMGERLLSGLKKLCDRHKCVLNARGLGLMTALDFPPPLIECEAYKKVKKMFMDKGVVPYVIPQRIIIAPPLIITAEEIDTILSVMDEVFAEADKML